MPELVLDLLKYLFLAVLYIFVARAIRAVYVELRPAPETSAPAAGPTRSKRKKAVTTAVVVEGEKKGQSLKLSDELIVGRAEKCHLVLNDNYVSQMHARIFSKGDGFMVEDLGSTNGTYLNRQAVGRPVELQRGDRVKIGKTVLEMRK